MMTPAILSRLLGVPIVVIAAAAAAGAGQPTADAPKVSSAAPAPSTAVAADLSPSIALSDCSTTMLSTDPIRAAETLPSTSGELIKGIAKCGDTIKALIADGQLGSVYLAAMLGKDMALALEGHLSELPQQRTVQAEDAIRRLVLAAWQLDQYSDLGNRLKLTEMYELFAAAIADISSAFDTSH